MSGNVSCGAISGPLRLHLDCADSTGSKSTELDKPACSDMKSRWPLFFLFIRTEKTEENVVRGGVGPS